MREGGREEGRKEGREALREGVWKLDPLFTHLKERMHWCCFSHYVCML